MPEVGCAIASERRGLSTTSSPLPRLVSVTCYEYPGAPPATRAERCSQWLARPPRRTAGRRGGAGLILSRAIGGRPQRVFRNMSHVP